MHLLLKENNRMEIITLKKVYENAEKEAAKLKKLEDSNAKRISNLQKLEQVEFERLEKCKQRLQRVIDHAARADEKKEADVAIRKKRMEDFNNRIQSRVDTANELERKNKIKAKRSWKKTDNEKKKLLEQRKQQRHLNNQSKAEERWTKKVEEQKKQLAKEICLQEQRMRMKENYQQQYMRAMQKAWAKIDDELERRKCRRALGRVRDQHRRQVIRQVQQSVPDAYLAKKSFAHLAQDKETITTLMENIQETLKEIRYDLEPYIVLTHAKDRLEKQENVPLPVSAAIKYLLDQTIVEYTVNKLSPFIDHAAKKVLQVIDEIKSPSSETQSVSLRRSTLRTASFSVQSKGSKTATWLSDVQEIPLQEHLEELGFSVEQLRLNKAKNHKATPMPSVTTLTEVIFKEASEDEFEEDETGEFPFIEQRKLNALITNVSNRILRMIPSRVKAVVEGHVFERLAREVSNVSELGFKVMIEDLPESKPVSALISVLLLEERMPPEDLTHIVDKMILNFMQNIHITPSCLHITPKPAHRH